VQWFVDFATNTYPSGAAPWIRKASNAGGGGTDSDINRQKGYGYKYLEWESLFGGYADSKNEPTTAADLNFPATPTLTYSGGANFPVTSLSFTSSAFSDPQGPATYASCQWRIAEISAPGLPSYVGGTPRKYEITPLQTSAEITTAPGTFTLPPALAETGKTYRVRIRHKDNTGRWSHWSPPVQFTATTPPLSLLHYWNFNTAETQLVPTQTIGGGLITSSLTASAAVASDTGNSFAAANARGGDPAGSHLRVNNPLGATLNIALPTTGYQGLIVKYETRRSTQGASTQSVSYTLDGTTFIPFTTLTIVDGTPEVKLLDFRPITGADNSPAFALRITFQQGTGGTVGNNRLDNLTAEADALPANPTLFSQWRTRYFTNPADRGNNAVSGPDAKLANDGVSNLMRYALGVGPYDPVSGLMPALASSSGSYQFQFPYDPAKTDLVWQVKASPDLSDWLQILFDSRITPNRSLNNGWTSVPVPAGPKIFARLQVQLVGG
jgi:hypothetical protein